MNLCIFFLITLLYVQHATSNQNEGWHWTWTCNTNSGQCVKSAQPVTPNSYKGDNHYDSQTICRLTCGRYGALWPIPTISTSLSNELIPLDPSEIKFYFMDGKGEALDYIKKITSIFKINLEVECGGICSIPSDTNVTVYITSVSHNTNLLPDTDESYSLEVSTKSTNVMVQIQAETVFGVRHALETLSQLTASYKIPQNEFSGAANGLMMVANARIKDKPIYRHRGLLLDTARNYLPISVIRKHIDGMAASKMNVLHWHATDSQSFPIVSQRVPQLARFGAYSSKHVYRLSEIKKLLSYAKYRGVRIVLEIDAPSHAGNGWQWGPSAGLGELAVCVNKSPWRQYCIQPPCGQLNPANQNVYAVLKEFYKDVLDTFPVTEYFHMGGDEVFLNCWNTTEEIIAYMERKGMGRTQEDFLKLWSEYQEKSLQTYDSIIGNNNTPIILWSSILTDADIIEKYLPKHRYIIETWVPTTNDLPAKLLEKGYRLIISTKNAWYFDHGFWGTTQYYTWRTVYKNRLPKHSNVLGGEACMWGEYVDEGSVESRVWPRAAAVAERLWSDPEFDTGAVENRFYRHRERLVTRGIAADAIAPAWCYQNEGECQ